MENKCLPELLAPAGSVSALDAAILGGADAIYIGGRLLNARMNAKNFTDEQIKESAEKCHKKGVKLYVTVNTQIFDRELKEVIKYTDMLYNFGVDALIVADLGYADAIKNHYAGMGIHASTQASGHNADCAEALMKIGFDRMVCARELSGEEIFNLCKDSKIEIEQFIHGAMCVSQSGQCLASAMMGGRSGNRGVCAQPCRMCYNGSYPLSLKDMCLANHIPELIESGVKSLKIEGRMKSPSYVYEVTRIYRKLLDERRNATEKEYKKLLEIFSRGGFTDGYYVNEITPEMNGVRSENDKTVTKTVKTEFEEVRRNIPEIIIKREKISNDFEPPKPAKKPKKLGKPIFTARFSDASQVVNNGFFSHTYLPLDKYKGGICDGVILPPSVFPNRQKEFENLLEKARSEGAEHAIICNVGQIEIAKRYGFTLHGDFRLNVFNSLTAKVYKELGLSDIMLSPELTLPQMRDISASKSAVVYGKIPIMLLTKTLDGVKYLKDTKGACFPLIKEFGYSVLLNSVPFYMADKQKLLLENGVRGQHLIFTDENPKECAEIIGAFKDNLAPKGNIRRIAY